MKLRTRFQCHCCCRTSLYNAETYRKGETLVVNPSEACGYLSGKPTVALFDADRFEAKIVDL